jgi:hypothetical protein
MPGVKTSVKSKTDTRLEVLVGVQEATNGYVKSERTLYSKYWPLLDQIIEMAAQGMLAKEITRQFKTAYTIATKNGKEMDNNPQGFVLVIGRAITVSRMDPERLVELRKNGSGFHHVYKLAREELHESKPRPPGPKTEKHTSPKQAFQKEADEGVGNAQEYADSFAMPGHMQPDKTWRSKNRYILKNDPDSFISMLEELIASGLLPDDIIPSIRHYIKGD